MSRWGEEEPSAFWPESLRRVHGGLLPGAAALRWTAQLRAGCIRRDGPCAHLQQHRHFKRIFKRMDRIQGGPCVQLFFQQISSNIPVEDE